MTARHTPGPWHVAAPVTGEDVTVTAYTPIHRNPVSVARVYGPGILSKETATRDANARLIASAPALLAENDRLRDAMREAATALERMARPEAVARDLRAALDAARGGEDSNG